MGRNEGGADAGIAAKQDPVSRFWPNWQQSLLLTAATGGDEAAADAFCRWRDTVDLEAELDPGSYRLLPLVYHHMHRLGTRDPLMRRLKGIYRRSWCENQVLLEKARPLVANLGERGIETMLIEGLALALSYYPNFAARPVPALAIAVRSAEVRRSIAAIEAFGWRANECPTAEDLKYRHSMRFTGQDGLELELRWHPLGEACNDAADAFFWSSAIPLDLGGVSALQFDPTAALLHVILHGIGWCGEPPMRWISDALVILRREGGQFDWQRMIDFACSQRLTYRLGIGLGYLARRHDAPVPQEVSRQLRRIRKSLVERLEKTVLFRARRRVDANPLAAQSMILGDFCRSTTAAGPIEFALGLSDYVRYRWGLERRRDLLVVIPRGLMRRAAKIRL